jgi:ribonuclease BN (tRNA processing enzyme)
MGKLHHLQVGFGDCSVITNEAGVSFLFDCHNIEDHKHLLPSSKNLRGVFVSHQHEDHYSGLGYLRKNGYTIDVLVYSPYERRYNDGTVKIEEWNEFNSHKGYFEKKGTKLHAPYRQSSFDEPWWNTDGLKFWIIGPAKSVATSGTRELHDASLVVQTRAWNTLHTTRTTTATIYCTQVTTGA